MSDFESFINQQLNEYGLADTLLTKAAHSGSKFGPTAIAAKLGSETAKGEMSLRQEVQDLYASFKQFCGQQRINMASDLRAEDYVDFLIHQCQFNIEDPVQFIYGTERDDAVEKQFEAIRGQFEGHSQGDARPLAALAQQGNSTARYCLWQLWRGYRSAAAQLQPVKQLCGKLLPKARLTDMIERTAKIRLKRKSAGGGHGGAASKKGAPAQPQVATDAQGQPNFGAEQGEVRTSQVNAAQMWDQPAFTSEGVFAKGGVPNIGTLAKRLAQAAVKNDDEFINETVSHFNGMNQEAAANLARMLLEFFYPSKMHGALDIMFNKYDPPATEDEEGKPQNPNTARRDMRKRILGILQKMAMGTYNADEVHRELKQMFDREIGLLIVALLMCLSDAYDGSLHGGASGPGGDE